MIGLAALFAGLMAAVSIYLMLSRNTQRVIMGFVVLSNAVNLVVLVASGLPSGAMPALLGDPSAGTPTDPLPQAFILTAIVIGLGNAAFLIAMASRMHQESGSDEADMEEAR